MNCELSLQDGIYLDYVNGKTLISRCCYKKDIIYKILDNDTKDLYNEVQTLLKNKLQPIKNSECLYCDEKYCSLPDKLGFVEVSTYYGCNSKCKFCGLEHKKDNLENYIKTLYALKGKVPCLVLTSRGEPLLPINEMKEFFKSLKEGDYYIISFTTNGSMLDSEIIDIMKKAPCKFHITVSVNATDRKTYREIVGKDNFDKVIDGVKNLYKNDIPYSLSFVCCEELIGKLKTLKQDMARLLESEEAVHNIYFHIDKRFENVQECKDFIENNDNITVLR